MKLKQVLTWISAGSLLAGCPGGSQVRSDPTPAAPAPPARVQASSTQLERAVRTASQMVKPSNQAALNPAVQQCDDPIVGDARGIEAIDRLIDEGRARSGCSSIRVQRRGGIEQSRIESGYARLIGREFARELCSRQRATGAVLRAAPGLAGNTARFDALSRFEPLPVREGGGILQEEAALANTFSVLYSLGRAESSGFADEGLDLSARANRPEASLEAGLFQVSYDIMGSASSMAPLRALWAQSVRDLRALDSQPESGEVSRYCGIDWSEGSKLYWHMKDAQTGRPEAKVMEALAPGGVCSESGYDAARCFRRLNQNCPAFAVRFSSAGIRLSRSHWGPLNIKSIAPSCGAIFESLIRSRESVCKEIAASGPGADPARNND